MTARLGQLAKIALVANDSRTPALQSVADEKGRRLASVIGVDWEEFKRKQSYGYSRVRVRNFHGDLNYIASYVGTKNGVCAKLSKDGFVFFESDDSSHIRAVKDLQMIIKAMQKSLRACRRQFIDPCVISFSHGYIAREAEREAERCLDIKQLELSKIPSSRWLKAPSKNARKHRHKPQKTEPPPDKPHKPHEQAQEEQVNTVKLKEKDFYAGYVFHGKE
jgi:hypothetical protein